ncbi:CobW family GTP-binding protein [Sporichthya brevicatena]|uniref:CobW family GTP-binding protein n=1 Tax=Sporichthya brevicatena TaxID=171442 RepID=UPI0031D0AC55
MSSQRVPVVVLTGHLGSGKTTLLNFLLRRPGARVGVIVNDFGAVNVDAGLVSGQVDEPASIAGGCICCLPDAGGLDDALAKLTHPRLGLDVVIVEASGLAEPTTLARLVRFSAVERVRPGGVVEVVDAAEYFDTVDNGLGPAPLRFEAATLVVVNKLDRVDAADREKTLARITERVQARNADVAIVPAEHGRIDPDLIYDAAATEDPPDQLPFGEALRAESPVEPPHVHAESVTVAVDGAVEPAGIVDLLSDPPPTAYRIKGTVTVATRGRPQRYVLHVVGRSGDLVPAKASPGTRSELVAIGLDLDREQVRRRLERALTPTTDPTPEGLAALRRLRTP